MPAPKPPAFETLSLHAGQHPDPVTRSRAVPIYQTTSYLFDDADHAAGLFNLERAGHIYTRISNPTTAVLEERLAALEQGVGAVCTASGMAAMHLAIATLLGAGDHIVASASLYGGTINLLTHTLPRFGVTTSFVKPRDLDGFRAAIGENTRLVIAGIGALDRARGGKRHPRRFRAGAARLAAGLADKMPTSFTILRSFPRKRESGGKPRHKRRVPAFAGMSGMSLRVCHAHYC
jgi:Cys/Met metabolism PLP-dependent enzyme